MPADTPMVLVPRAWLERFDRKQNPNEAIADTGESVWDFICWEAYWFLSASPVGEGAPHVAQFDDSGMCQCPHHSTTSTAEQVESCPVCGCEERTGAGYLQCECPAPSPGEGDARLCPCGKPALATASICSDCADACLASGEGEAPVAWRYRYLDSAGGWSFSESRAAMENAMEREPKAFFYEPLFTRPTPATPEGLRPFGLSPLEIKRIRSALIDGLEKAYWAGSEVAQGFDAAKEADAILSALRPQAQGGE